MNPGLITAIVSALAVIGPGIAWWVKRRDTNSDPIPKGQAAVALADSAVGLANETLSMVASQVADLRARVGAQDQRIAELEQKHVEKSRTVDDLTLLVRQLFAWIKEGAKPPPPTIPPHLRDQIGEDYELAHITERSVITTQTERIITHPPEEQQ